ncbi:MAG: hypothetical protein GPOALKHO_001621 [Sodalis sp.]|nr:MAG: hypothetical protein GPOALKHO_001621 [Sodalis sp.]
MRQPEIFLALHFLQTRQAALVLETQQLPLIEHGHRHTGGDHQLDAALVEFIHTALKIGGRYFLVAHRPYIV